MTREKKPGNSREFKKKAGKSGNFLSIILFLKKKNCQVRFRLSFFRGKNKTF